MASKKKRSKGMPKIGIPIMESRKTPVNGILKLKQSKRFRTVMPLLIIQTMRLKISRHDSKTKMMRNPRKGDVCPINREEKSGLLKEYCNRNKIPRE
jgi:hypothetical protein